MALNVLFIALFLLDNLWWIVLIVVPLPIILAVIVVVLVVYKKKKSRCFGKYIILHFMI